MDALRMARRPLPVAELVRLRFGDAPTSGEREAIAAAARHLEAQGRVTSELAPVLNARGARRMQRVVTLTGAEVVEESPPVPDDDEFARAARTPDAPVIWADDGGYCLAVDERAVHSFEREVGLDSDCDEDCRALSCITTAVGRVAGGRAGRWAAPSNDPGEVRARRERLLRRPEVQRWLAAEPEPVVVAPDGSFWAVLPGRTVAEVVAAVHAERPFCRSTG